MTLSPGTSLVPYQVDRHARHTPWVCFDKARRWGSSVQLRTSSRRSGAMDRRTSLPALKTGRLMAILCHNSDFGDAWEWEQHPGFPREVSWGRGIPMGVNIAVYALTH